MKLLKICAYLIAKSIGFVATLLLSIMLLPYEHILKPAYIYLRDLFIYIYKVIGDGMHTAWFRAYHHCKNISTWIGAKWSKWNKDADAFFAKF